MPSDAHIFILGAGVTGLAAGYVSGLPIYEQAEYPGGICASYYVRPGDLRRLREPPSDQEAYRFEIGGGHWIFGGDPLVIRFIRSLAPVKSYMRRSSVYFPDKDLFVPYPIQNNLRYLGPKMAAQVLNEIVEAHRIRHEIVTMADWLLANFGPTLCEIFFYPFHERYTGGLFKEIAPQDEYKTPVDLSLVIQGALGEVPQVGYNATFLYPEAGLNMMVQKMAERCKIHYSKRVVHIDILERVVYFEDGTAERYEVIVSTLPLNRMVAIAGLVHEVDEPPDPATSVLVVNIGAKKGPYCPEEHWLYIPQSRSGFHRVGFYSNVDSTFLPASARGQHDRVSLYVEKAYREDTKLSRREINDVCLAIVEELQEWGWIEDVEVIDPTWIDVAYTWSWPGSRWRTKALRTLEAHSIYQVGRYARWKFQGIADSIRDGLIGGGIWVNLT
jgi:protoporphyrinogen oxidase